MGTRDEIKLPSVKDYRTFGIILTVLLAGAGICNTPAVWHTKAVQLIVAGDLYTNPVAGKVLLAAGALALVLTLFAPKIFAPVYNMIFKKLLERVIGPLMMKILCGLVFIIAVVPVGIIMRIFGKNFFGDRSSSQKTYWIKRPEKKFEPNDYERMF